MLRVDFTFDKKIIEKNGYTMSNIYETIKMEFDKKNISCVAEGEVLSFGAGEKKNDFSATHEIFFLSNSIFIVS